MKVVNEKKVQKILKFITRFGNFLTALGCFGLFLGFVGFFDLNNFAFGLSSGIRVVGSLAIAGCLLSAVSYGILDFKETNSQAQKE